MPPLFDGYLAVDWSANNKRKTGANSIWVAAIIAGDVHQPVNPGTRREVMELVVTLLDEANRERRRLLCGFDFPFGYQRVRLGR